jgi:3-methyladenine DNA glycosylase AlkD
MQPVQFADELRRRLEAEATPERAGQERRYLRSRLEHLGVNVPAIRSATRALVREAGGLGHDGLVATVDELWSRGVHELRMAAVELLEAHGAQLTADDVGLLERLLREAGTWALIDGLAASVVGPLVDRYPRLEVTLDRWAGDDDFWLRRSALLAHLLALRRGEGDFDRFARYADGMLDETEFFIRKAIGWVLRDAGRHQPERVVAWLGARIDRASGVTVREAVKRLPQTDREALLAAYRARS